MHRRSNHRFCSRAGRSPQRPCAVLPTSGDTAYLLVVAIATALVMGCSSSSDSLSAADQQRATSIGQMSADLTAGKDAYASECASCHGADGKSGSARKNITSFSSSTVIEQVLKGGDGMPALSSLSDQQIANINGYVQSL